MSRPSSESGSEATHGNRPDAAATMDLDRLAAGDATEWKRFLEFSRGIIQAAAYKTGLPPDEHDELIQITCVICFQAVSKLRDPSSLGSWVYRIAYRQSLKIIRGTGSLPAVAEDGNWILQRFPSSTPMEDEILEQNETSLQLRQAIAKLGDPCRRLITELYLEDESPSYEDISVRLGMPMGSIGPTRARCLDRVRQDLKQNAMSLAGGAGGTPTRPGRREE